MQSAVSRSDNAVSTCRSPTHSLINSMGPHSPTMISLIIHRIVLADHAGSVICSLDMRGGGAGPRHFVLHFL